MTMIRHAALLIVAAALTSPAWGGKYNDKVSVGDRAPAWKNLPGVDGEKHSLSDLADKDVVVVVFTCNSCPYAADYEARLIEFARDYTGDDQEVALVAINVNRVPEDRFPQMQERAKEKGLNFPYLYDETQQIARDYGAKWTPEFFVLDKERKIVYMGAFDDNAKAAEVKSPYVEPAVTAALAGNAFDPAETPAVGCAVRYVVERKKKKK